MRRRYGFDGKKEKNWIFAATLIDPLQRNVKIIINRINRDMDMRNVPFQIEFYEIESLELV